MKLFYRGFESLPWLKRRGLVSFLPLTEHSSAIGCSVTVPSILSSMQCSDSIAGPRKTKRTKTITRLVYKFSINELEISDYTNYGLERPHVKTFLKCIKKILYQLIV